MKSSLAIGLFVLLAASCTSNAELEDRVRELERQVQTQQTTETPQRQSADGPDSPLEMASCLVQGNELFEVWLDYQQFVESVEDFSPQGRPLDEATMALSRFSSTAGQFIDDIRHPYRFSDHSSIRDAAALLQSEVQAFKDWLNAEYWHLSSFGPDSPYSAEERQMLNDETEEAAAQWLDSVERSIALVDSWEEQVCPLDLP